MLKPGTQLGPYEILSQLGAGGMGEVYKARDTRLERFVAVKVLPDHLADDPDLRERFEREARTIAQLNHPHICVLYDIGSQEVEEAEKEKQIPRRSAPRDDTEGVGHGRRVDYLVMEYLEGETLAERLKKGLLPLDQVLRYAVEVSDALDKAHRAGVTHRDIKPGNIIVTKEGTKLLDFGLAKLKQEVAKATIPASEMPTVPGALTGQGTLLGTLHYMAPEQVEGKINEIDARTDIFAFGALVYEMATGKRAFPGETQASVIAKILEVDPPPMSELQPPGKMTPPALDRVVKRCLAKDAEDRWQAMRDVCHELKWITEVGGQSSSSQGIEGQAGVPVTLSSRRKLRDRATGIAAAVFLLAFLAALVPATRYFLRPTGYVSPVRFSVETPPGVTAGATPVAVQLTVSPDGRNLAYVAPFNARNQVWVRPLDSPTSQPVPGTEAAISNFWSPDGHFVGFFTGGELKKVDVSGGPAQTLCDWEIPWGATWNEQGVIVFGRGGAPEGNGLYRVSAAGGEPTRMTGVDAARGEVNHMWPYFLPDGRHFLYTVQSVQAEHRGIYAGALDSEQRTRLLADFSMALYAPPGYLLFVRQGTLMAQPFDAARLELSGEAFPIAEKVAFNTGTGQAGVSVSRNGVLAYRTGGFENTQLAWVDRSGKQLGTVGSPGAYLNPRLSPDGKRVAVEQVTGSNRDIWVLEVERGVATRFTFDPADEYDPLWSPDGQRIAFVSKGNIYQKPASGAGTEEVLLQGGVGSTAHDWSSDGEFITYRPTQGVDIWVLPLAGDRKPFPFLESDFNEVLSRISPDGKWLAYLSLESGRYEVYVQSFPKPGAKFQISTSGGAHPVWRRDGKELFYIAPDQRLMAVPVRSNGTLEVGAPQALFETHIVAGASAAPFFQEQYDVAPDGQRFLMNLAREGSSSAPIHVVLNWFEELKRRVPAAQ